MAARHLLEVPAGRRDAEPAAVPARGQRGRGAPGAGGALPGLLARLHAPAPRLPLRPVRAAPRRAAG